MKALQTWRKIVVQPGETIEVELQLDERSFRRWSVETGAWTVDPERYHLLPASSAAEIHSTLEIVVGTPDL